MMVYFYYFRKSAPEKKSTLENIFFGDLGFLENQFFGIIFFLILSSILLQVWNQHKIKFFYYTNIYLFWKQKIFSLRCFLWIFFWKEIWIPQCKGGKLQ